MAISTSRLKPSPLPSVFWQKSEPEPDNLFLWPSQTNNPNKLHDFMQWLVCNHLQQDKSVRCYSICMTIESRLYNVRLLAPSGLFRTAINMFSLLKDDPTSYKLACFKHQLLALKHWGVTDENKIKSSISLSFPRSYCESELPMGTNTGIWWFVHICKVLYRVACYGYKEIDDEIRQSYIFHAWNTIREMRIPWSCSLHGEGVWGVHYFPMNASEAEGCSLAFLSLCRLIEYLRWLRKDAIYVFWSVRITEKMYFSMNTQHVIQMSGDEVLI